MWLDVLIFTSDEINNSIPLNDYFEMNGYQSKSSVMNLGSTYFFFLLLLSAHLLLVLLKIFRFETSR